MLRESAPVEFEVSTVPWVSCVLVVTWVLLVVAALSCTRAGPLAKSVFTLVVRLRSAMLTRVCLILLDG